MGRIWRASLISGDDLVSKENREPLPNKIKASADVCNHVCQDEINRVINISSMLISDAETSINEDIDEEDEPCLIRKGRCRKRRNLWTEEREGVFSLKRANPVYDSDCDEDNFFPPAKRSRTQYPIDIAPTKSAYLMPESHLPEYQYDNSHQSSLCQPSLPWKNVFGNHSLPSEQSSMLDGVRS